VIVRISGSGQWRVPDEQRPLLNELDDEIVRSLETCDQAEFSRLLHRLLDAVTEAGERLPDDELLPSDVVLPATDTTLEEAREIFAGEGVIAAEA
jgi:hypothetical protein